MDVKINGQNVSSRLTPFVPENALTIPSGSKKRKFRNRDSIIVCGGTSRHRITSRKIVFLKGKENRANPYPTIVHAASCMRLTAAERLNVRKKVPK
ncbi:hypothetical protein D3C73_1507210 [compost metagenome]